MEIVKQWYYRHYSKDGYCQKRCFQSLFSFRDRILTVQEIQDALNKWNETLKHGHYSLSSEGRPIR